jgi:hypothetical protein
MSGSIDDLVTYRINRAYETLKEADKMNKLFSLANEFVQEIDSLIKRENS